MNHKLWNNYSEKRPILRKIGLFSIPIAISMLAMKCSEKVENIFQVGDSKRSTAVQVFPKNTLSEAQAIAAEWEEADENQVLKSYSVKKGDTLFQIARKHGVTVESMLKINKKITSANAIQIGETILIPYDGTESTPPPTLATEWTPVPLAFDKKSLVAIMRDVLTRPEWNLIWTIGDQPSDVARLKIIAEKAGLWEDVANVQYANLCAANMRAVSTSLKQHLQESGIDIDLGWNKWKNGIGVGQYFSDLSQKNELPKGYQVVTTKNNPNPERLKQLLLDTGSEYSIFVLSYSHAADGHVNLAFRVGEDIIIFDPSWKGKSAGWPERFHRFEDYVNHFVVGNTTTGYTKEKNRYDLFNVTCVPAHRIDQRQQLALESKPSEKATHDDNDMRSLTMVFEGFAPRMHVDTRGNNKVTYAIGYGTNIGTMQSEYPFGSYGKEVADYFKKEWHSLESIKQIMQGKKDISQTAARDLFEMRYIARYQKLRTYCGKNWNKYPPIVRNMLVDMSYNMGEYGIFPKWNLPGFPDAVAALNRGDWIAYINAIVDSKYAEDVGARRVGKWIGMIVHDILKEKTSGLSAEAQKILFTYTAKHSIDLNTEIAQVK